MSIAREIDDIVLAGTRPLPRYWIVSQVNSTDHECKIKRTATSTVTRWLPYNVDLTLNVGDTVAISGLDLNSAIVTTKLTT